MRVCALGVLLLVSVAREAAAQPPSTQPPSRVTQRAPKPRDPHCAPIVPATNTPRDPIVSAPPSTAPAISATPPPGAVNVPAPIAPDATPTTLPGCGDDGDVPSE